MYEDTTVQLHSSGKNNFPTLDMTQDGTAIQLFDYVLVDGYGTQPCAITVSSGTATVTCTDHGYTRYDDHADNVNDTQIGPILEIAGATQTDLNGKKRCTIVDANTLTYATTEQDGAATGSITIKTASLGWTKLFHDPVTHKAVYKPSNVMASDCVIYVWDASEVTDTYRKWFKYGGAESATDANTLVDILGTDDFALPKYSVASSVNTAWEIIGNDMFLRLHFAINDSIGQAIGDNSASIGNFESYVTGDQYNFVVFGTKNINSPNRANGYIGTLDFTNFKYFARAANQTTKAPTALNDRPFYKSEAAGHGMYGYNAIDYPAYGELLYRKDVYLIDNTINPIRGKDPGIGQFVQRFSATTPEIPHGKVYYFGTDPYRVTVSSSHYSYTPYTQLCYMPIKIVGPW